MSVYDYCRVCEALKEWQSELQQQLAESQKREAEEVKKTVACQNANADLKQENARLREALRFLRNHTSVSSYQIECIDQALGVKATNTKSPENIT